MKNGSLLFKIKTNNLSSHSELRPFNYNYWKFEGSLEKAHFKNKYGGRNGFNDIRLYQYRDVYDRVVYELELKNKTSFETIEAKAVVLKEVDKKLTVEEYSPYYKSYQKALARKEKRFDKQLEKRKLQFDNHIYLSEEMKQKEIWKK